METTFSVQTLINEAVKDREDRPKERWWATDFGKCLGGAYYSRLGEKGKEKDDRTYRVFKAGNLFEQFVIDTLKSKAQGYEFIQPKTIYLKEHDLAVRPDLIVKNKETGKQYVYEFKSCHSDKFWWMEKKGEGPDKHYLMQTYCELMATGIEEGRLMYISKDDLCIAEYSISIHDEEIKMKVLKELQALNEAWRVKVPPPVEPAIVNGKINWKAQYCPHHHLCLKNDNWLEEAKQSLIKVKKGGWKKLKTNK